MARNKNVVHFTLQRKQTRMNNRWNALPRFLGYYSIETGIIYFYLSRIANVCKDNAENGRSVLARIIYMNWFWIMPWMHRICEYICVAVECAWTRRVHYQLCGAWKPDSRHKKQPELLHHLQTTKSEIIRLDFIIKLSTLQFFFVAFNGNFACFKYLSSVH